ncbi:MULTISPECIES: HlyD family secretion protein [unclassified Brucella]|uniref:HlyD family secretion protein n=1 Tax=unclassified Brucella TaxID=2632610 RepID=UPI000972C949|nr:MULTISPECIES: HlyD family secretion protein [unclassified Brucella]APX68444.1 hemolysin secretion protein D [Brucella sp. 09RB8471]MRN77778.1 HlyD family efflux transporter periplasmic adaptor subunit [Brucella sp. 10RB9210]
MSVSKKYIRGGFAILIGLLGVFIILWAWQLPPFKHSVETTDNAYVRGQVTVMSPQVSGYITKVNVTDYEQVKKGDLLFEIDSRSYQQKLDQALAALDSKKAALANSEQSQRSAEATIKAREAQISGAKAALEVAKANTVRVDALLPRGVTTQSSADTAHGNMLQAQAAVDQAEAALAVAKEDLRTIIVAREGLNADLHNAEAAVALARIDLQNTKILAPRDGKLGEVGVRLGQYVTAGTQLVSLVPDVKWIMANFKETQLYGMKVGQPVTLTVDALRHAELKGHIEAFSPATGSEFSVIKSDNATGNFTKITQRLSVRISIDEGQPDAELLAPGMSVVVRVDTASAPDK